MVSFVKFGWSRLVYGVGAALLLALVVILAPIVYKAVSNPMTPPTQGGQAMPTVTRAQVEAAIQSGDMLNFNGHDLRGVNLSGLNLSGADFSYALLEGANLSGSTLEHAILWSAQVRQADLRAADLRSANLSVADLTGANLSQADLRGAELMGATLSAADLRGANLTDTNLRNLIHTSMIVDDTTRWPAGFQP